MRVPSNTSDSFYLCDFVILIKKCRILIVIPEKIEKYHYIIEIYTTLDSTIFFCYLTTICKKAQKNANMFLPSFCQILPPKNASQQFIKKNNEVDCLSPGV